MQSANEKSAVALSHSFDIGDWVKHGIEGGFGIVGGVDGEEIFVNWSGGFGDNQPAANLQAASADEYLSAIKQYAEEQLQMTAEQLWAIHMPIANGRDKMDFDVLAQLESKLLEHSNYESTWATIEETAKAEEVAATVEAEIQSDDHFVDIFAQYEAGEAEIAAVKVEGEKVETVRVTAGGPGNETNKHGVTFEENITPIKAPEPIKTEAGLIDPETGELLQPSLIMRKFGWTELPVLPPNPTKEEKEAFRAKLDQVADVVLNLRDQTARWTAANELRCKPLNDVADFWEQAFLIPQAKMLAPYDLPRYKSGAKEGQYSGKSLVLPSGCIDFTKTGGHKIFNPDLVKKHIQETGIEKFACIDAKPVISYNHDKLMAALKSGTLTAIPGTEKKAEDELGKIEVVSSAQKLAEKQAAKEKREATKKAKAEQAQSEEPKNEE